MQFFVAPVIVLLWIGLSVAHHNLKHDIEEDLKKLKETCHRDSCTLPRVTDSPKNFTCQCGVICSQLGTCCIDSPYLLIPPPNVRPTCRSLDDGRSYFMVDRCTKDNDFRSLCEEEWNGDGDAKKIVPVTSLFSFVTYKNYFCFRCHEETDDFAYWDVRIRRFGEFDQTIAMSQILSLTYDRNYRTWFAPFGRANNDVSVTLSVQAPPEVGHMISECDTHVISNCSRRLTDEKMRDKCEAYMGVIQIAKNDSVRKYKNMHCALCNFEDLSNVLCEKLLVKRRALPFTFSIGLDMTRWNTTKNVEAPKCEKDFIWDPYFKKCRKLRCALPGYVYKNGKCIRS